jgi:hypothetical protein
LRLVEPWDSPENDLTIRPRLFSPVRDAKAEPGLTHLRMFVGGGAAFDRPNGVRPQDLPDPANTIFVVEAAEPVPWLMPEGLPYDPHKPLPPLGGAFQDGFFALMGDGSVRFIPHETEERVIRSYITGKPLP